MRTKVPIFSAWNYVGPAVEAEIKNEPEKSIATSELVAVMTVAICPAALTEAVKNEAARELATRFSMFYSRRPDLVLRLLNVIRKRWADNSVTAMVQRQILTRLWTEGVMTNEAPDSLVLYAVKPRGTEKDVEAGGKARGTDRVKLPQVRARMTWELFNALQELRRLKFDIGWGY